MAQTLTARGVLVRHPDEAVVTETGMVVGQEATRRRRSFGATAGLGDDVGLLEAIAGAAERQDLEVVESIEIATPFEADGRRRRRADTNEPVELEVPLEANERALLLVECDGVYAWQTPEDEIEDGGRRRRDGGGAVARFVVPLAMRDDPAGPRPRRWLAGRVFGALLEPVRAVVLRFAADKVLDAVTNRIEEHTVTGLVPMRDPEADGWRVTDARSVAVRASSERPRVLLFVHGTFSSTMGSFGALAGLPWGRALLEQAHDHYDAVVGFDHSTLRADPMENAKELLTALQALDFSRPPVIDAVAYSRGGLVLRAFAESVLPASGWDATVDKAVFVGCTLGGTALADPEHWHALLDLTTNAAAATGRIFGALGAGVAAVVFAESVKTVASLARAVVVSAIDAGRVPGIAAMQPRSALVTGLNDAAASHDAAKRYFAVTADFAAGRARPGPGMGERLLQILADRAVDRLIGDENDLVVNTAAMVDLGGHATRLREQLDFGTTGDVHHMAYFVQPEVATSIARWLGLAAAATPRIDVRADDTLGAALERSRDAQPDALVLVSRAYGDETLYYPRRLADLVVARDEFPDDAPLLYALDLHETGTADVDDSEPPPSPSGAPLRVAPHGHVVLERGAVRSVVAPPLTDRAAAFVAATASPRDATRSAPPALRRSPYEAVGPAEPAVRRRRDGGRPALTTPPEPGTEPDQRFAPTATRPSSVRCHFYAEMPEQPPIERAARVEVTISRAELDRQTGPTAARASADVSTDASLTIQVVPRSNCRVEGSDREVIDVPDVNDKVEFVFEVRGIDPGEAELWVEIRQGARRVATMVLQPVFVVRDGTIADAVVAVPAEPSASLIELLIFEDEDEARPRLTFVLRSDDLDINLVAHSSRLHEVTKAAYVGSLYKDLETYNGIGHVEYEDFMDQLRERGSLMYEELVPLAIRTRLWDVRDRIGAIRVSSQEPSIPWELAHIKEPNAPLPRGGVAFFAEKGLVRWMHNVRLPPVRVRYRGEACHYLVPEYELERDRLPGAASERKMIRDAFAGAREVVPHARAVRDLLAPDGELDLLHVACHGEAEGGAIWEAQLVLQRRKDGSRSAGDRVGMPTISQSADLWRHRPLVFLNACQLGRQGRMIAGTGGLAEAFVRQGAGMVVASLWSTADEEALTFARTFYAELVAGRTLVDAAAAARAAASAKHEPTWLAYAVYGHPFARLVPR